MKESGKSAAARWAKHFSIFVCQVFKSFHKLLPLSTCRYCLSTVFVREKITRKTTD